MKGNTSHAVRAQRHEPIDSLDDFPTPPWATRLFLREVLEPRFGTLERQTAWEPACNRGYMARPMAEAFACVHTSDIADYGWVGQQRVADFLTAEAPGPVDWIITNPPFVAAEKFVRRCAHHEPRRGFAIIARLGWMETDDRFDLFEEMRPALIAPCTQRVPMFRGRYDPEGSTATGYAWFVWRTGWTADTVFAPVPKGRDRHKRPDDVGFETRDVSDWVAAACEATPLFAGR